MAPDTLADWSSAVWLAHKTGSGGYVYSHHHWNGPAKVYVYSTPKGTWAKCTMCSALLSVPKWRLGRRLSEREKAAETGDGARSVAVTYEGLLQLARRLQGQTLETMTGRKFTVGLSRGAPFFTPESSGSGRSDGPKAARRFVERYTATGSLRPGDYADITRNASYFVGMLLAARKPR